LPGQMGQAQHPEQRDPKKKRHEGRHGSSQKAQREKKKTVGANRQRNRESGADCNHQETDRRKARAGDMEKGYSNPPRRTQNWVPENEEKSLGAEKGIATSGE